MGAAKTVNDFFTLIEINENLRSELMPIIADFITDRDSTGLQELLDDPETARYLTEDEIDFIKGFIRSVSGQEYLN